MSYFNLLTVTAARTFEPKTVAEANGFAVLRVVRWFVMTAAVALAITAAAAWAGLQLGLAVYAASEGAPQGYTQYFEPIGPMPALTAAEAPSIAAPAIMEAPSLEALTVVQLRKVAGERGISIRRNGRTLRKTELIQTLA